MPIKSLTNRPASFPEIGQLRKGGPKVDEKRPGPDLTYFRFTSDVQEVAEKFTTVYGTEPRMINVFLPFRTVEENFECWQEEYNASALKHRCDGETMTLWLKQDGTYSTEPKPCDGKNCKPVGRLKVIIPELGRLAFVTVLTTSVHDIRNLDAQLRALASLRGDGDLRGIPMQLRRRPDKISTPGTDGKRVRREKWLLSIEAAPNWVTLQLASQEQAALPVVRSVAALPAPSGTVVIHPHTGEIIAAPEDWEDDDNGVEDGEWTVPPEPYLDREPPAPSKAPTPEPPKKETKKQAKAEPVKIDADRPLPAAEIRRRIRAKAWAEGVRRTDGEPITANQLQLLTEKIGDACKSKDGILSVDEHHARKVAVLRYLIGVDTANALMKAEAGVLLGWLSAPGSSELGEWASQECAIVYAAYQEEQGQTKLPLGDEPPF